MRPTPASAFAEMGRARLVAGDGAVALTGVSIDSRTVCTGDLFVALAGRRVHGADFAAAAVRGGASGVLIDEERAADVVAALSALRREREDLPKGAASSPALLTAADALAALQCAAAAYRRSLSATVVGITGSTGKTTTKDLLAAAIAPALSTVCSSRSHNNEIGVPLTLLAADSETEVVVVELAMRGLGQIRDLVHMALPSIGVVTNVGVTHFELLGSVDLIARAKGELVEELPADGLAVINGDDRHSAPLAGLTRAQVVRFGLGDACDVRAESIRLDDAGRVRFAAFLDACGGATGPIEPAAAARAIAEGVEVALPLIGRHNVYNALAALAVARRLGVDLKTAASGMSAAQPSPMRLELFEAPGDITVLADCYNASPASMTAALQTLAELSVRGRRVAVLGEMLELGALSLGEHLRVGRQAADAGVDMLVTVGEGATSIASGALKHGLPSRAWVSFRDAEGAAASIRSLLSSGDAVLVKASRAVGLERVIEALTEVMTG